MAESKLTIAFWFPVYYQGLVGLGSGVQGGLLTFAVLLDHADSASWLLQVSNGHARLSFLFYQFVYDPD